MYVQYKVNVSENQVDTLVGVTLCLSKGGIRGDHVLLLTPVQINRFDGAQAEGRSVQFCLNAKQVAKNASYNG